MLFMEGEAAEGTALGPGPCRDPEKKRRQGWICMRTDCEQPKEFVDNRFTRG